jgi:hypothetical protein
MGLKFRRFMLIKEKRSVIISVNLRPIKSTSSFSDSLLDTEKPGFGND